VGVLDVLQNVSFGQRVAEEEGDQLATYFVETDHWRRLFSDSADIVYGPKGAGKSALYSLLVTKRTELFDRRVLLSLGEKPRGAPAFAALVTDPPATEREFIALWKLYLACLIALTLEEYGVGGPSATELRSLLEQSGLRPRQKSLQATLLNAFEYVKRLLRPTSVEAGLRVDPLSQIPTGVTGKISFGEPTSRESDLGITSVDRLLEMGKDALEAAGYRLWVLLDRLDVAFSESPDLEQNALRALFHVYLDVLGLAPTIRLKIFLRTDIWRRITSSGFREASHITRHLTIEWNAGSLLNLVIRRAVQNAILLGQYRVSRQEILASGDSQNAFFYKMFPDQVEAGSRKSNTFDWMLGRTWDGTRQSAPRELIHLLNSLRDTQVRRLEIGDPEPDDGRLFAPGVFKAALPEVSRTRLEQTLYAEYPEVKRRIEQLRGAKTQHSVESLSAIWKVPNDEALRLAATLLEIGFFDQRGERDAPIFWVPFLYRDALDLVQGAAD
jgi:hypothetical protein